MIKRALISVSDKTGIVEMARELQSMGVDIISTGGTAKTLSDAGIKVITYRMLPVFRNVLTEG